MNHHLFLSKGLWGISKAQPLILRSLQSHTGNDFGHKLIDDGYNQGHSWNKQRTMAVPMRARPICATVVQRMCQGERQSRLHNSYVCMKEVAGAAGEKRGREGDRN